MNFKNTSTFLDQVLDMRIVKANGRIEYLKNTLKIGIVLIIIVVLCGCSVVSRQEESNTTLSVEHEALCNSKNTLNKKLCRQTMGQLPKFESDMNTYFKEKFHIDGFKLTGINFPYDGFNHGGFYATFQLASDPYVMITSTFDYSSDGRYMIRPASSDGESDDNAGMLSLSTAILVSEYLKTLPIEKIENDMTTLGIVSDESRALFNGFSSGRYFKHKNLTLSTWNGNGILSLSSDDEKVINNYVKNISNESIIKEHNEFLKELITFRPMMYAINTENIKRTFEKYQEYLSRQDTSIRALMTNGITFYYTSNASEEKIIALNGEEAEIRE